MPQKKQNAQQFYFTRREIEMNLKNYLKKQFFCKQCKKCINCSRAEYVHFEVDRKMFYTYNKDIKNWKIKRLVISPVFQYCRLL